MEAVSATGYAGPLSLRFSTISFAPAPRSARDRRLRSLILLEDSLARMRPTAPQPATTEARSRSVGFVEFAISEAKVSELATLFGQLGFRKTGPSQQGCRALVARRYRTRHQLRARRFRAFALHHHGPGLRHRIDVDDAGKTMARRRRCRRAPSISRSAG